MSQNQQILKHMQSGHAITSLDAFTKFNCTRLAARISDIKDMGHTINTKKINRGSKSFAEYSLEVVA